jgi:predicted NBD/HSP70 family sugar kinase
MRRHNRALVLDLLLGGEHASRSAIAERTGLAKPTVSLIVEDLLAEGLVDEVGQGGSTATGGRPPVLLAVRATAAALVGVHVGVTRTTVVVADLLGVELGRESMPTPDGRPATALKRIAGLVTRCLASLSIPASTVASTVVCLPGLVDIEDGRLLLAPNLGWEDVPVVPQLSKELGFGVLAVNTSRATLLAELMEGAARDAEEVVLVYAGSGVGAALASGGRLVSGGRGVAGELGHCRVRPDGIVCGCGKTGCLESVASAEAVVRAARAGWGRRAPKDVTAQDVASAAADGDRVAIEVLQDSARTIGGAAAWMVNLFDPDTVVLAGGLAGAGPVFTETFEQAMQTDVLPAAGSRRVVLAALGQDAEVRGAILLAREQVREQLGRGPLAAAANPR